MNTWVCLYAQVKYGTNSYFIEENMIYMKLLCKVVHLLYIVLGHDNVWSCSIILFLVKMYRVMSTDMYTVYISCCVSVSWLCACLVYKGQHAVTLLQQLEAAINGSLKKDNIPR